MMVTNKNREWRAVSYNRRHVERQIRTAKFSAAKESIGRLEKGGEIFILTFGQFSLIDALVAILDQTGPADVVISTWTAADAHLQRSAELLQSAEITDFKLIVDQSFYRRQPEYFWTMQRHFGEKCVRVIKSHAKFMLIRNSEWDIVVRTSMNLNENPRLENLEISDSREFAEFFQQIVDEIFQEVGSNEVKDQMLRLESMPESHRYREIQGDLIPRAVLRECFVTHTIKRG